MISQGIEEANVQPNNPKTLQSRGYNIRLHRYVTHTSLRSSDSSDGNRHHQQHRRRTSNGQKSPPGPHPGDPNPLLDQLRISLDRRGGGGGHKGRGRGEGHLPEFSKHDILLLFQTTPQQRRPKSKGRKKQPPPLLCFALVTHRKRPNLNRNSTAGRSIADGEAALTTYDLAIAATPSPTPQQQQQREPSKIRTGSREQEIESLQVLQEDLAGFASEGCLDPTGIPLSPRTASARNALRNLVGAPSGPRGFDPQEQRGRGSRSWRVLKVGSLVTLCRMVAACVSLPLFPLGELLLDRAWAARQRPTAEQLAEARRLGIVSDFHRWSMSDLRKIMPPGFREVSSSSLSSPGGRRSMEISGAAVEAKSSTPPPEALGLGRPFNQSQLAALQHCCSAPQEPPSLHLVQGPPGTVSYRDFVLLSPPNPCIRFHFFILFVSLKCVTGENEDFSWSRESSPAASPGTPSCPG